MCNYYNVGQKLVDFLRAKNKSKIEVKGIILPALKEISWLRKRNNNENFFRWRNFENTYGYVLKEVNSIILDKGSNLGLFVQDSRNENLQVKIFIIGIVDSFTQGVDGISKVFIVICFMKKAVANLVDDIV